MAQTAGHFRYTFEQDCDECFTLAWHRSHFPDQAIYLRLSCRAETGTTAVNVADPAMTAKPRRPIRNTGDLTLALSGPLTAFHFKAAGTVVKARRGVDSSERLGRYRWIIERTFAWLARFRRLTIRPGYAASPRYFGSIARHVTQLW